MVSGREYKFCRFKHSFYVKHRITLIKYLVEPTRWKVPPDTRLDLISGTPEDNINFAIPIS